MRVSFRHWLFCVLFGGVVCPLKVGPKISQQPVPIDFSESCLPPSLTPSLVREAFAVASEYITCRRRVGGRGTRMIDPPQVSAATTAHRFFLGIELRSLQLMLANEVFEEATTVLRQRSNLSPNQILCVRDETNLPDILGEDDPSLQLCQSLTTVDECESNLPYRTIDGRCNNLKYRTWGMASTCLARLLEPAYSDGQKALRLSVSGRPLPRARRISLEIHTQLLNPADYITHMFMQWGQFLDHDLSLSHIFTNSDNNGVLICCPEKSTDSDECLPVIIDDDDPFLSQFRSNCLENIRSAACANCQTGPREQINQLTAYIDASHVYGNSKNESDGLRTRDGTGTLRSQMSLIAGELLPDSDNPQQDFCSEGHSNFNCFQTGDQRANVQPGLVSLHTLFLREHNRLAQRLGRINPSWDGDTIFEEARRILGAQMQMITYKEFVHLVIGHDRMKINDLYVGQDGYSEYQDNIPATIINEFSTAAYRFGHSLINSFFAEIGSRRGEDTGYYLKDLFLNPFGLYSGQLERILRGLVDSPSKMADRHMVEDVTNFLYQQSNSTLVPENATAPRTGLDLAALNILRGRDHGLPGYIHYVRYCSGIEITNFSDLDRLFLREARQLFEKVYEHVEDIDLFSGGLAERPEEAALVGPTFSCILSKQFYRLKFGDRFYFEHGGQTGSFTPAQLTELRKITLAKIICDNTDVTEIQLHVMHFANNRNPVTDCDQLQGMDLNAWRL